MNSVLIEQVRDVKELIDFIVHTKGSTVEHVAIAIDEDPFHLNELYENRVRPTKRTLMKLCNLYCLICLERQGY